MYKQVELIMTRNCDNPECEEVIYRDTLDKDIAYRVEGAKPKFVCSIECVEVLDNAAPK